MKDTGLTRQPQLQVPHAGYHWDGSLRRFFEGWYFRITLPQVGHSFAFMYSIEDPQGDTATSGGMAQILGPQDQHQWRTFPEVRGFWADRQSLALGHWGATEKKLQIPPQYLSPDIFERYVRSGYQTSDTLNQGSIQDPITEQKIAWRYRIEPVYSYGFPPQATMGWLSYLPVFEPGWQILMAHGWAYGWVQWQDQRYIFDRVPAYIEKNWGGAFPGKWFWIHCNAFRDYPDLSLTCAGGRRGVLWWQEDVGLLSIHWRGEAILLLSENAQMSWQIDPWGNWKVQAEQEEWSITLEARTQITGTQVYTPTQQGMQKQCRDTLLGQLQVQVWRREGQVWAQYLHAKSALAGLETGGGPWSTTWIHSG